MCIACELGYWAMVDALEAERAAAKKKVTLDDSVFTCEPTAEENGRTELAQRTVDEPAP
jgi:hypothetical protein